MSDQENDIDLSEDDYERIHALPESEDDEGHDDGYDDLFPEDTELADPDEDTDDELPQDDEDIADLMDLDAEDPTPDEVTDTEDVSYVEPADEALPVETDDTREFT